MYKFSNLDGTVIPPGGAYPYGDAKDNPDGTKVNRKMVSDLMQFAQRMAAYGSVVPNELPDNGTNGFQIFEALIATIGIEIAAIVDPLFITWATPSAINADYDEIYPVTYGKDGFGNVYIRGVLETNTATPTNTFFTLPGGYRPTDQITFAAVEGNAVGPTAVIKALMVTSGGDVKYALDSQLPTVIGTRIDLNAIIYNISV